MYRSLLPWCRFPVSLHKCTGYTASGDRQFAEPVDYNGYRVDEMRVITDKHGDTYTSYAHIYFPPEVPMGIDDCVSFPEDPQLREVRKLGGFHDGNEGRLSIWVVYL